VAAPDADIQRDVLYTDDGTVCTSAGVVGGLDLCLHLVRRELGAGVAGSLARRLVMPPVRAGGQRQYVEAPVPARPDRADIASTVDWAVRRLAEPIGVADLAARAGLSERAFHREFRAATGATPGKWLLSQRIRHAQKLLETTDLAVGRVAERSGLGTAANLRRRLRAELGVGPDAYRRTFGVRAGATTAPGPAPGATPPA
jgi:transcriptional regulator GlxA family with amidase domain